MDCISCDRDYDDDDDGACVDCYNDLKAKVDFLKFSQQSSFSDVLLFASDGGNKPVPAYKAVLASRSPVFRAMLQNEMKETVSGTIQIADVSYVALRAFVNYLYTAEPQAKLDQQMACDLLVLAEKYQVQHLKEYCQKFLVSNLNWDNALMTYTFAHLHNAKRLVNAAVTLIIKNMDKLTELKKKDPQLVLGIYEAYISKQVTTMKQPKRSN